MYFPIIGKQWCKRNSTIKYYFHDPICDPFAQLAMKKTAKIPKFSFLQMWLFRQRLKRKKGLVTLKSKLFLPDVRSEDHYPWTVQSGGMRIRCIITLLSANNTSTHSQCGNGNNKCFSLLNNIRPTLTSFDQYFFLSLFPLKTVRLSVRILCILVFTLQLKSRPKNA